MALGTLPRRYAGLIHRWGRLGALAAGLMVSPSSLATTTVTPAQVMPTQESVRFTYYGELMSPALVGTRSAVPRGDGSALTPFNLYGWFSVDVEAFSGVRLLYFQRFLVDLADERRGALTASPSLLDPRVGIRLLNLGSLEGLRHTLDAFLQLPVTEPSREQGRRLDAGVRSNASYAPSHGRWSLGLITDAFGSSYREAGEGPLVTASLSPWGSITLTPTLSTQHWVLLPFQYGRRDGGLGFSWDYPAMGPYIQNGLGWEVNEHVWVALFVNNHLSALPTFQNTWVSGWLYLSL